MLKILLPIRLPRARVLCPEVTARRLTASSGDEVPSATTVSPTTRGEMPAAAASRAEPRTRSSPPRASNPSPTTIITKVPRLNGSTSTWIEARPPGP